jgi:protein TonB
MLVLAARMPRPLPTEEKPEPAKEVKPEPADEGAPVGRAYFPLPPLVEPPSAPVEDSTGCSSPEGEVLPFGAQMTRPVLISGAELLHTPEAREARVQGLLIVKCVLTCQGEVRECRILKGLPHMNEAALAMFMSRRYHPVRYLGRPVTVSYVFNVRLPPP